MCNCSAVTSCVLLILWEPSADHSCLSLSFFNRLKHSEKRHVWYYHGCLKHTNFLEKGVTGGLTCNSPPVLAEGLRACGDDRVATAAPWPISVALQTVHAWPAVGVPLTWVVGDLWGMERLGITQQDS